MANKKIKMNEKNADGTFNVLHPETTTEQVINPLTGQSINEHFTDTTKKHIEIVEEIPANLVGKGVFFEKQDGVSNAPNKPTIQDVYENEIFTAYRNETALILTELRTDVDSLKGIEPTEPSEPTIFSDDFNRENANNLGENWEILSGSYSIVNNMANPASLNVNNFAVKDVGIQDNVSIATELTFNVSEGIMFRAIDKDNNLVAQFELGNAQIYERLNGVKTVLQSVTYGIAAGEQHKMRVELRGSEIKIFANDSLIITQTRTSFLSGTKCGITSWSNSNQIRNFDNFEVKRLSTSSVIPTTPTENTDMLSGVDAEVLRVSTTLLDSQGSDRFTFAHITDIHYQSDGVADSDINGLEHIKNVSKLTSVANLDLAVFGADLTQGNGALPLIKKDLQACVKEIKTNVKSDYCFVKGNHDDNSKYDNEHGNTGVHIVGHELWFNLMLKSLEQKGFVFDSENRGGGYYYKDYDGYKIRVIVLNDMDSPYTLDDNGRKKYDSHQYYGFRQKQLSWLATKALNFTGKIGYGVIVCSHVPLTSLNNYGTVANSSCVRGLLKAYKEGATYNYTYTHADYGATINVDFTAQGIGEVIGVFNGHIHSDSSIVENGILHITTNCSRWASSRPSNTVKADSFDIIVVDRVAKKIIITKFGTGANREFNY